VMMSREGPAQDAPVAAPSLGVGKQKTCVGFERAAALPTRKDCKQGRQAMALLGLGYADFVAEVR